MSDSHTPVNSQDGLGDFGPENIGLDDPNDPHAPEREPSGPTRTTAVIERERVQEQVSEPGDHERFAHYVRKNKIMDSAMSGEPVVALCGKVWVPGRDPKKFPVCPTCKEIFEGLRAPQDGEK